MSSKDRKRGMYSTRTTCRLCNSSDLQSVVNLGDIYISSFVDSPDVVVPKVPLELIQCQSCNLIQLRDTVNSNIMYADNYWYQSGLNKSMVDALKDVVDNVLARVNLSPGDIIVDIGANDGTMINMYSDEYTTVAFEPSNLSKYIDGKASVAFNTYFSADVYNRAGLDKAKVITAIAMFYDLEDPHSFVNDLKNILADDGLLVIQMMDLLSMVQTGDFPNICHEHLEYYSLAVFKKLMEDHELTIVDVEYNTVNGGSLRAYIKHNNNAGTISENVYKALKAEQDYFDTIGDVAEYFNAYITTVRNAVVRYVKYFKTKNLKVAVMGASTKGNTLLQFFGLDYRDIDHAAEINSDKFGKLTIGTNIPIISDTDSLAQFPVAYLILPWGFLPSFISRYKDYLVKGGSFIIPLPQPRVLFVDKDTGVITEWTI